MYRRVIALLTSILILSATSFSAFAVETDAENKKVVYFEDGSYLEIILTETNSRAVNTTSGKTAYYYRVSNGDLSWQAVLSASFTYTGTSSTCTSANCTVTIYDNAWYEVSKSTTRSGNTATTALTMGQKFLGITINKPSFTLTLTCDKNGNLS